MNNSIIIYQTADNQTEIEVRLNQETVWLSLNHIADLFGSFYHHRQLFQIFE
jgi:hypothetical protein